MTPVKEGKKLTRKDFTSDQVVRWCPGCGDYSILAQVQNIFPDLGIPRENIVFVSGIGCAARFPYYMNTYGFHGIHGRAPALATGLKVGRPELSVWVVTGDGDGLSIGGNHLIHAIRRNVDLNILLFNNRIYGLTKGQYSPTSEVGKKTKSTPLGSVDAPLNPLSLALGSQASFVARTLDRDVSHLRKTILRANEHKGTSFVEIYQNCPVFNDGAFEVFTDKKEGPDHVLTLEDGKPFIYGKNKDRGVALKNGRPEVVSLGNGGDESSLMVHREHDPDPTLAFMLSQFGDTRPDLPTPIGVLRAVDRPTFEDGMTNQVKGTIEKQGAGDLEALLNSGDSWLVE